MRTIEPEFSEQQLSLNIGHMTESRVERARRVRRTAAASPGNSPFQHQIHLPSFHPAELRRIANSSYHVVITFAGYPGQFAPGRNSEVWDGSSHLEQKCSLEKNRFPHRRTSSKRNQNQRICSRHRPEKSSRQRRLPIRRNPRRLS
jgi:hypothetical protein